MKFKKINMKELLLKIAGVKTEEAFYKKFPNKETFFKAHPEAKEIIAQYQQQEMMANAPENSQEQMMGTQEEMVEQMANGGNVPTNPSLWSKAKSAAKAKYDVYPSAYANGFAAKWYKEKGGSWKKAAMGGYVDEYANGGEIDNSELKNLQNFLQKKALNNMIIKGTPSSFNPNLKLNTFVDPRFGEDFIRGSVNPMYYDKNFSFGPYFEGVMDLNEAKINNYGVRGSYNLNDNLSINADLNPNNINAGLRLNFKDGGGINNSGFKALPKSVQENIISNMSMGGEVEEYGNGGYTVRRSNDRKGKTHVVTGPDGTKKYFGDPKLGERSKSKYGKEAFYARHKTNLKNNPFFRAYARSTWADGGILPEVEQLMLAGQNPYNMGGYVEYPTYYPGGGMIGSDMMDYQADYNYPTMYPGGGMIAGPMMGYEEDDFMYAMGGGININPANEGKFTEWAAKRGMTVQEAANKVMANRSKYTADVVKMANFAKNAAGWKKAMGGRIYEEGGMLNSMTEGIPVQTETFEGQAEQVALPDGTIKSVEATTSHENMSDNTVTDLLPGGSHIQSARNKLTPDQYIQLMQMFKPETADQDIKKLSQVYQSKYGKKDGKKLSPADISEYAKNKYQNKSTPNSFDTDKLKEGNKKAYLDLSMQMNDLIKSGKELAEGSMSEEMMMAYGGMVNKYQEGTPSGGLNYFLNELLTPGVVNLAKNTSFDKNRGKYRLNVDPNMSLQDKIDLAAASEDYGIQNLVQGRNKDFPNFVGGFTPQDFEKRIVYASEGPKGLENKSELDIRKKALNLMGYKGTLNDNQLNDVKSLYNNPKFKEIYNSFTNYLPSDKYRKTKGNDFMMGAEHFDALGNYVEPTKVVAAATPQTPAQKAEQQMLSANTPIAPAARVPMQNRFNFGLLEGQLGRGLGANQSVLEAGLAQNPLYIMETPDTYIRSRKNEVPVGNILYNIERAQRNSANALADQTGDWSTLAGNIANAGAQAYNQLGDTLSALNQTNVNLYNETQGLQQDLLGSNMGVRNQNLTNMQNMLNFKRNLFGQKAVKDSEIYSEYSKSMGENAQKEQNQKMEMLNIMASKPDMFKGEQGQMFVNQILGNTGSYNNPIAGTLLDNILSANRYKR